MVQEIDGERYFTIREAAVMLRRCRLTRSRQKKENLMKNKEQENMIISRFKQKLTENRFIFIGKTKRPDQFEVWSNKGYCTKFTKEGGWPRIGEGQEYHIDDIGFFHYRDGKRLKGVSWNQAKDHII